ncbi:MAG: DNA (cytosine-5-)-methyltransferase [Nitrospiraceae bacterium]|nr:DNA (cytosine-5-)-methyltransferase [Nitrospiraceae bacterium]|tara:strand:- start:519 stop:1619 length:1101 start_codon:yes stop_codon:yes gene_type:complete
MGSKKTATKKTKIFHLGEFFCGPGGLALGALNTKVLERGTIYKIQHAWANDLDKDSCETFTKNICPKNPKSVICDDVANVDYKPLKKIDGFAYGFPCNDFSIVGKKKGFSGKFGPLYMHGVNILNYFKPKFFVAENVGGITSADSGFAFRKIVHDLRNSGNKYNLTIHLYNFEEYGIPQIRRRIIIVGIDSKLDLKFKVPAPTHLNKYVSAKEAIEIPPIQDDFPNHEFTKQSQKVVERLKHTKPWENAWNATLPSHLKLNVKGAKLSHIYRRLHPNKPSYTITGSGGGGTHGYHWKYPRALTNRERARLQAYPDEFVFCGSKESVRKQIGMAVPPKISEMIFTNILKTLLEIKYPAVPANIDPNN